MDDKRDGKKKVKKLRKSRSRSVDKRRSPSRSPSYGRRRRERSRSRDRVRRRSPSPPPMRRRGRGRRSPSPPPPPSMQIPPPPMIGNPAATAAAAYMGSGPSMYDAYGGYAAPPPPTSGGYMGDMGGGYGGYDYGAPGGAPSDGYGGMMNDPGTMMMGQPGIHGADYGAVGWNTAPPPVMQETEEEKRKREAAIALEVQNQRASLKKQRDDYRRRAGALKRELKILKQQRSALCSGREPPSPTTNGFVKENDKLQSQIQSKISTIENVIDMLDGIIGKDKTPTPPPPPISDLAQEGTKKSSKSPGKEQQRSESGSPERLKKELLQSMKRGKDQKDEKTGVKAESNDANRSRKPQFNFVYFDPELHWCSLCDIFPKTAKDYLNHLHSEQHRSKQTGDVAQNFPWREKQSPEETKNEPGLPSKRTPIRGLQFFVPATAWYCKICDFWMGDLPSASLHLKSHRHSDNYADFIDSHANFEIDWMSDRQKAYEKMRDSDHQPEAGASTEDGTLATAKVPSREGDVDFLTGSSLQKESGDGHKKRKKSKEDKKDKKKKKRSKKKKKRAASSSSSSSSSDSDSESDNKGGKGDGFDPATSIRVAMRNLLQEASKDVHPGEESIAGKWTVVQTATAPKDLAAPPPPYMTVGAESREKKRDELMISQWITPDPIISDSEKKLLEQLKGKLKKRDDGPSSRHQDDSRLDDNRGRGGSRRSKSPTPPWRRGSRSPGRRGNSRSPVRRMSRSPIRRQNFAGRDRRSPMDRKRNRDFDRGRFDRRRRSRSRGRRSPSYGRGRFRARRSFSRSRSRSRSRGRRVIEKPVVNFPPEPKPKPEKKVKEKRDDDKKEKKNVSVPAGQKKLPFIGRMPVFKKQQQDAKKEELMPTEKDIGPSTVSVENGTKLQPEEFVDMMPDPYQYVALMGVPPPPPAHPTKPDESMLPPGIDEEEADLAPKPISDAPIPRKGPLPKDFQEALDILFDGDKPKPAEMIANETKPQEIIPPPPVQIIDSDQPQMIVPEAIEIYNQQIAAQYSTAVVSAPAVSYDDESQNQPLDRVTSADMAVDHSSQSQPVESSPPEGDYDDGSGEMEPLQPAPPPPEIENEETRRKRAELEELAMLGIDADDMAAQIF